MEVAQFDFFTQPRGPNIDINLYPQAANAGIQGGNAQKTIAQSIMGGVEQGVELYNQFQNTQIKQHEIDRMPVKDRIQDAQAQNEESIAKINDLKAQVDIATQTQQIDAVKSKLQMDKVKADEETASIKKKNDFESQFSSMDPNNQKDMIFSGQFNDVFAKYPEVYKRAVGSTFGVMNDEEKQAAGASLNALRALEIENEKNRINGAYNSKAISNLDKLAEKVGRLKGIAEGMPPDKMADTIEMYPAGVKQYDPKTGMINKEANELAPSPMGGYDVFVNDKKSDKSSLIKDSDYDDFTGFQDAYFRAFGKPKDTAPQPEAQKQTSAAASSPQKVPIKNALENLGIPKATANKYADDLSGPIQDEKTAGGEASWIGRQFGFAREQPSRSLTSGAYPEQNQEVFEKTIKDSAETLTNQTLKNFKEGSPEVKESIRTWAEANGVKLTPKSLQSFYEKQTGEALDQAFKNAWEEGIEEKARANQKQGQADRIINNAYRGKPAPTASSGFEPTATPPALPAEEETSKIDVSPQTISSKIGVSSKVATGMAQVAKRVNSNPVFQDRPAYVKAIGAVESSGQNGAVSTTGVMGPMQVTKPVANQYGVDARSPEENAAAGQMYIEDLFKQFNGNKALAYAAYNSGPGVVEQAIKMAGTTNWDIVKRFMFQALKRFESVIGVPATKKIGEVYSYPERVMAYEDIFS